MKPNNRKMIKETTMSDILKKTDNIKKQLRSNKRYIIIAAIIGILAIASVFLFFPLDNSINKLFDITNKYIHTHIDGTLDEDQMNEVTKTVNAIIEESNILEEPEIDEKIKSIKEQLNEKLSSLSYLTEDEITSIIDNMEYFIQNDYKSYFTEMNTKTNHFEELLNELNAQLSRKADVETVNEISNTTTTLINVDDELKRTDIDLYTRLVALNTQLSKINNHVDNVSDESDDKLKKIVNEFNILLNEMKTDTSKDYSEKLSDLKDQINHYINEINRNLTDIYADMEEADSHLSDSISNLKSNTDAAFGSMKTDTDEAIKNLNNNVKDMVDGVDSSLREQIENNRLSILGLHDAVAINQESIGNMNNLIVENKKSIQDIDTRVGENTGSISDLNLKVNDCFQSVSDGKALLASTLTDKGISTVSDASFGEINNNILNLYTAAFAAGVDSVSGINADVEYEYHHHEGSATCGGGCYTIEDRHYHTGSSSTGGGCYTKPNYNISYIHPSCSGAWVKDKNSWGDKDGNGDRRYRGWCSVCGYYCASYSAWNSYPGEAGPTHTSLKSTEVKALTGYSLGCGYADGQLLGYKTSCGMIDGQIISAKVNLTNTKAKSASILASLDTLKSIEIETDDKKEDAAIESVKTEEQEQESVPIDTVSGNEVVEKDDSESKDVNNAKDTDDMEENPEEGEKEDTTDSISDNEVDS